MHILASQSLTTSQSQGTPASDGVKAQVLRSNSPFHRHAELFLECMPVLQYWGDDHTTVMRSTINKYLVPFFGSKKVRAITDRDLTRFKQHLETCPLSTIRKKTILRVARQVIETLHLDDPDITAPVFTTTRKDREKARWLSHYEAFKSYWVTNKGNPISDQQSFAFWVNKQRFRFSNKLMTADQLELLKAIDFPFVAPKTQAMPTNMEYARRLIAFYQDHGHFSPTQTVGGAGLTHWVRNMRESGGTCGLAAASDDPKLAEAHLCASIPTFDWGQTWKSEVNFALGLSHNGFAKAPNPPNTPTPNRVRLESARALPILHGARGRYPTRVAGVPCPRLRTFLDLAVACHAPVRVLLNSGGQGFVVGIEVSTLHCQNESGDLFSVTGLHTAEFESVHEPAFENGYWGVKLYNSEAMEIGQLDMDWVVAEQFVGNLRDGHTSVRTLSVTSTRFKHFIRNIQDLTNACDGYTFERPLHIGWATHRRLFKYLEHARRKNARSELGRLELTLLNQLPCTIGAPDHLLVGQWVSKRRPNEGGNHSAPSVTRQMDGPAFTLREVRYSATSVLGRSC